MLSFIPSVVLLANLAFSNAAVIPEKRSTVSSVLSTLGVLTGTNSKASGSCDAWLGTGGDYISEFVNDSGEDLELVVWGSAGSWVNVVTPMITYSLSNGSSTNVSFASGVSGGWAAIYNDTKLVNGQISETWGEFTFDGQYSTFDVSREVNMQGHNMSIKAEGCTSNMTTCVFQCTDSDTSCMTDYELLNCATGSQTGAEYGTYDGAASGGCLVGSNNYVKTTFA